MATKTFLPCLALLTTTLAAQQALEEFREPTGRWRAWLASPGGELPFGITFTVGDSSLQATIHNGRERIRVPTVKLVGRTLTLGIDYYDSRIVAELSGEGRMRGTWTKQRGPGKAVRMQFHARKTNAARFPLPNPGVGAALAGRWRVQFAKDPHPAVAVFEHGKRGVVHGTFLTTLGDYRYLAGNRSKDSLRLSCFDGAHAFLFTAKLQADGTLAGDFWSSNTWHETWRARRDAKARLPDAWTLTKADAAHLGRLRFPDLDGKPRSLVDPAFAGKARVVVVFGSWCPNCKDETAFLAELDRKYRPRGLSVLGLAFEHARPRAANVAILRRYAKHQNIEYPILLAGLADKNKASQALPLLDRVRSFPTTLFLRGDGTVRAVHTGFSGPGTGAEYQKLRRRFERLVEELLKSP